MKINEGMLPDWWSLYFGKQYLLRFSWRLHSSHTSCSHNLASIIFIINPQQVSCVTKSRFKKISKLTFQLFLFKCQELRPKFSNRKPLQLIYARGCPVQGPGRRVGRRRHPKHKSASIPINFRLAAKQNRQINHVRNSNAALFQRACSVVCDVPGMR